MKHMINWISASGYLDVTVTHTHIQIILLFLSVKIKEEKYT